MKIKLLTFVILAALLSSCDFGKKTSHRDDRDDDDDDDIPRFVTKKITYSDSIELGPNKAVITLEVDFPTRGPGVLVDSVRTWITDILAGNENLQYDSFLAKALKNEPQELLKDVATQYLDGSKSEFLELNGESYGFNGEMSEDQAINNIYASDDFVTFRVIGYEYAGGAHGMPWDFGQTFYRNGHKLGWDMFDLDAKGRRRLAGMIFEGIRSQYFDGMSAAELKDFLFLPEDGFPLPSSNPFLTEKGMEFTYGAYEIGPYAAGLPSCVIPLSELRDMLNPTYFLDDGERDIPSAEF